MVNDDTNEDIKDNTSETDTVNKNEKEVLFLKESRKKDKVLKKQTQLSIMARNIQDSFFFPIWSVYKVKENIDKIKKVNIASHFFFLGAKSAFKQGIKDYTIERSENKQNKMHKMELARKLKEIKKNALKVHNGGLNLKYTLDYLKQAISDNNDNPDLIKSLNSEIDFFTEYQKKKVKIKKSNKKN
ncbi:MAG: hypothetical protein K0B02_04540 [DPANN group archaeon]|nr:hypothetical protein [DPANN group archaeon]